MTGDQKMTDEISDDKIQVNLWKLQLEIAIKNKIEKIKNLLQGVRDTRSIEKPKMWTSKVVTEFMNGSHQTYRGGTIRAVSFRLDRN